MVIKNVNKYEAVFRALSTFKALPRRLLMEICGISEDEVKRFVKKKTIFPVEETFLALTPRDKHRDELVSLAWAFSKLNINNCMITSAYPYTAVFTAEKDGEVTLSKLVYISGTQVPLVKSVLEDEEAQRVVFVSSDAETAQMVKKAIGKNKRAISLLIDYSKNYFEPSFNIIR